jgi:phage shock protein PspC (stress-responsive transcriptional regulator)
MNKVITINLGGTAFQLEEAGYDALGAYLDGAASRLRGNPDREEILSDIEHAIGDKFRTLLTSHKNVVTAKEVAGVLEQMGPIEADSPAGGEADAAASGAAGAGAAASQSGPGRAGSTPPKRLYRINDGAMIAGVCNGIAAYFNVDPTIVRLAFVVLTLAWGTGILVYLIMALVVPQALTPEEKEAACGTPPTAQDFIRRAKQGYYEAMKSFPDRHARREWKRRFRQEMRDWRTSFHRECRGNVDQWRQNWHAHWGANPASGFALPFVSVLHGALVILFICALISLLATGAVFGVIPPAGVPVWVALLVLLMIYGMLVWPLKAARRAFYFSGAGAGAAWPFFFLIDAIVWIAVVGTLVWLAMRYSPQAREAVQNIPAIAHDAVNTVRDWWQR